MFRELTRKKQALSQEACIDLLKQQKRGVLSVLGDDGYPYGVPLNYWYDPAHGRLYFHSGKTGHKIDAIKRHNKVSFCVTDQGTKRPDHWSLDFNSVVVFGWVQWIDEPAEIAEICAKLSAQFTHDQAYIEQEIRNFGAKTICFALVPEQICGKRVNEA